MKKLILLILFAAPLILKAQLRDSVRIKNDIFEIIYSEKMEGPVWIKYEVQCSKSIFSRKGLDFYTNDSIHTSDAFDYINNVYDKGHMAPAADFSCDSVKLKGTFSYINCSPQNQYLNRGVWRLLEEYERELKTKYEKVLVEITPKYSRGSIKLQSGAVVPDGYWKKIIAGKTVLLFYFENSKPLNSDYMMYLVK